MTEITPTQWLMMEVLAARLRLGENHWTFPNKLKRTAKALEGLGLVTWKGGIVQGTIMVSVTDLGRREWGLYKPYKYPTDSYGWPLGAFPPRNIMTMDYST